MARCRKSDWRDVAGLFANGEMVRGCRGGQCVSAKPKLGRPRKRGRPRKQPGEPVDHRLTPKVRIAILAIVEDDKSTAEAAAVAGLTSSAIRKAMRDNY